MKITLGWDGGRWFKYINPWKIKKQIIKHYFTSIPVLYQIIIVAAAVMTTIGKPYMTVSSPCSATTHSATFCRHCNGLGDGRKNHGWVREKA